MKSKLFKELDKLEAGYSKFQVAKGKLESMISDSIEFDFSIEHLPGDGFCILNCNDADVAQIGDCLSHIEQYGKLDEISHKFYTI